jgi:hypothetical protein
MNTRPLSKEYLHKRLLIVNYGITGVKPIEATLLELSPSEEYAKIQIKRVDGTYYNEWRHVHDYVVLEKLREEVQVNEEYTSPTVKTPSYWDSLPTSICSSDYADAPDWHATNYEVKKNKWVQGMCNPPSPDWKKEYVKNNTSTGKRYSSVDEMLDDLNNPDNCWNS